MGFRRRVGKWTRSMRQAIGSGKPRFMRMSDSGSSFYPIVSTCQIPQLGFLFSYFLGERFSGVFVEVGGFDGVTFSNTYGLAVKGWRGIYIEPQLEYAEECRRNHEGHDVVVCQTAATAPDQEFITLQLAGALTTANDSLANEYAEVDWATNNLTGNELRVAADTLDNLLQEYQIEPEFDLLVIDVEGCEADVLAGFSLNKYRPSMVIIELVDTHPDLYSTKASDYLSRCSIESEGYKLMFKDSINSVFIREDLVSQKLLP